MSIGHDEAWLREHVGGVTELNCLENHQAARDYHEHQMRLRPAVEYDDSMGAVWWFDDKLKPMYAGSGVETGWHFQQINIKEGID